MITAQALRALMRHLESQVELVDDGSIRFEVPDRDALLAAGLEPEAVQALIDGLFEPDFAHSRELEEPLPARWSDHLIEIFGDYLF